MKFGTGLNSIIDDFDRIIAALMMTGGGFEIKIPYSLWRLVMDIPPPGVEKQITFLWRVVKSIVGAVVENASAAEASRKGTA